MSSTIQWCDGPSPSVKRPSHTAWFDSACCAIAIGWRVWIGTTAVPSSIRVRRATHERDRGERVEVARGSAAPRSTRSRPARPPRRRRRAAPTFSRYRPRSGPIIRPIRTLVPLRCRRCPRTDPNERRTSVAMPFSFFESDLAPNFRDAGPYSRSVRPGSAHRIWRRRGSVSERGAACRRRDGRRVGDGARGEPAPRGPSGIGSRCSISTATPPRRPPTDLRADGARALGGRGRRHRPRRRRRGARRRCATSSGRSRSW